MDRFLRFLSRMLSHIAALLLLMAGGVNTAWAQSGDTPLFGRGGFIPLFGGLGETAGVSGGVRYDAFLRHPNLTLAADVRASIRTYAGVRLMTGFENDRFSLYGYGRYRYQPKEVFYGLGPSDRDTASDYRLDERIAGASGSVKPFDGVAIGINASVIDNRFGNGRHGDFPQIDETFGIDDAPGMWMDSRYGAVGMWIEVDRRDLVSKRVEDRFTPQAYLRDRLPLGTNRGWYVAASAMPHFGLGDDENDFVRYTVEGQYFLPMGLGTDGIASRVQLASVRSSETPMFYLMPTLGGAYSVRGFRPHRFRAENTLLVNLEYRRSLLLFLDLALFVDAGQAFRDGSRISRNEMEYGYGAGLRGRIGRYVFGRVDLAHSREGLHVYFRAGSFL